MGQGPNRDEVDAGRRDRGQPSRGRPRRRPRARRRCRPHRGPRRRPAAPSRSMLSSSRRCAPDSSAAATSSRVTALDLDRQLRLRPPRGLDRGAEAAGEGDVVLLDQDRVVEAHPVVAAAAREHRGLLQLPQPRRGLARVEDRRAAALARRGFDEPRRQGCDAGEVAEQVERHALGGKQRPGRSGDRRDIRRDLGAPPSLRRVGFELARLRPGGRPRRRASKPKRTPACFCTIRARAPASAGTVASAVTSPLPRSSASARATRSRKLDRSSALITRESTTRHPRGPLVGRARRSRAAARVTPARRPRASR